MNKEKNYLKKIIKYRLSYSGMKETDILYKKIIINKIDTLSEFDLRLLSDLFNEISDADIFNMLTKKTSKPTKYKELLGELLDE